MNQTSHWQQPNQPIWIHRAPNFLKAIFKSRNNQIITSVLQNGETITCRIQNVYQRNPLLSDVNRSDLMELDIINQPEILIALKSRLQQKQIYTYVENTLIVLNPYFLIEQKYSKEAKDYYIREIIDKKANVKDHPPHAYSLTSLMISQLVQKRRNQAIVISGQSGSGKTQTNKECLRFMSHYFNKEKKANNAESKVQKAILLSNPVLQAFGNSKTIRNNNSSRFGKYLSICVDQNIEIKHAQIYNYLLQKSRLISRADHQQNFHIFYEFIQHLPLVQKMKYKLVDANSVQLSFDDFNYLKTQRKLDYKSHPDVEFHKVRQSLQILPHQDSFDTVCRVLSAVLYLGNLQPYQDDDQDLCLILPQSQLQIVCNLLQVDIKKLRGSLTMYSIKIGGQDLVKSFGKRQVQQLIHSLSKTLYQRLFQWIINQLNKVASSEEPSEQLYQFGFLDIYGFEVLQTNSLQQLFINYTNQRLHQIYLQKIFKIEKSHFQKDGLGTKFKQVDFQDNVQVIDLIDTQNLSIFNLLDEWCAIASPDESSFITNIRYNHKKNEKFPPSNFNIPSTSFIVRHTPRDVDYVVSGFKQKNKDLLREQIKLAVRQSKHSLISSLFIQEHGNEIHDAKSHKVRKFLSSKFRKQMNNLVYDILSQSQLHFMRCIKPNSEKKPLAFNDQIVFQQIKYLGILDTIKIKKMGYCIKIKYQEIDKRFSWLVRFHFDQPADKKRIQQVLKSFLPRFSDQQRLFGNLRIFFKDYAYSIFLKKYNAYYNDLKSKAHKLISLFVKNRYAKNKNRKINYIKTINQYIHPLFQQKYKQTTIKNVKRLQHNIKLFLKNQTIKHKLNSITTIQAYIKRKIYQEQRIKKIQSLAKIIRFLQQCVLRRQMESKIVSYKIITKHVINQAWQKIKELQVKKIQKYFQTLTLQGTKKTQIAIANHNTQKILTEKYFNVTQNYLSAFASAFTYEKTIFQVKKIQSVLRSYRVCKYYKVLKKAAIKIQRAWRQYRFLKKGSRDMFTETYKFYDNKLLNQNEGLKAALFHDQKDLNCQTIDQLARHYLENFKQKMSILYFMIDIEAFIDMDYSYPQNSWRLNYFNVCRQSYSRQNPIQYLQVGQSFTVAATTNKLYVWGMNQEYRCLDNIVCVKTKQNIEKYSIQRQKLQITYEGTNSGPLKIASTVNRAFNLQNGKVFECYHDRLRMIKMKQSERVMQIACGQSHTIIITSSKKVYTFGNGKKGQLGHKSFSSEDNPRVVSFFEEMKTNHPLQVAASFSSSIVLLSNNKVYWFGSNGTIKMVSCPVLFDMRTKSQYLSTKQTVPLRIVCSWSRSMSIIGLSLLHYNNKLKNNIALRNKIVNILISKWHQKGIDTINPPYIQSVSDHLDECHVKLPKTKINIEPQGKKALKQLETKAKSMASDKLLDISFSDSFRGGFFK